MRFAFHGEVSDTLSSFADRLSAALTARGYERTDDLATANLVCNFVNRDNVRPYRRENKTTFCAAILARTSSIFSMLAIPWCILFTTATGVAAGTNTPHHTPNS